MAEYTTNLNLEKPEGNENFRRAVINANMDILDEEVAKKASSEQDGRMSKEDKAKLDTISADADKVEASSTNGNVKINGTETKVYTQPAATSSVLGGVKQGSNVTIDAGGVISVAAPYTHPATHAPGIIVQDANNRFCTDTEKSTWNNKQNALSGDVAGHYHSADRSWANIIGNPFNYSGQGGQPTWVWGSSDGANYYVWNPSNFNVNYASSANYASTANYANSAGSAPANGGNAAWATQAGLTRVTNTTTGVQYYLKCDNNGLYLQEV